MKTSDVVNLLERIADQATRVRRAQVQYFRTRCREDLVLSKQHEGMLDSLLVQYEQVRDKEAGRAVTG